MSTDEERMLEELRDLGQRGLGERSALWAVGEITRLRERERLLLDSHTGCGCEPTCKVCVEKGYT